MFCVFKIMCAWWIVCLDNVHLVDSVFRIMCAWWIVCLDNVRLDI